MRLSSRLLASLAGRLALVTGSTSGIGLGIAQSFAARGCDIVLHGFGDDDVIQKAKSSIESHNVRSHWEDADLCDVNSINAMVASIGRLFPRTPDILVNNAECIQGNRVQPGDLAEDAGGSFNGTVSSHTTLHAGYGPSGLGRIINISSVHGHIASPYKSAYVTTKHGVVGLTKVVALETAGTGVTCNAVCPGYVETPLFIKQAEARSQEQGISYEEARRQLVSVHATEEPVKVEDIGELVCFLCSPSANQMTGSSVLIDGAWSSR